jgi:hypothetical protein
MESSGIVIPREKIGISFFRITEALSFPSTSTSYPGLMGGKAFLF